MRIFQWNGTVDLDWNINENVCIWQMEFFVSKLALCKQKFRSVWVDKKNAIFGNKNEIQTNAWKKNLHFFLFVRKMIDALFASFFFFLSFCASYSDQIDELHFQLCQRFIFFFIFQKSMLSIISLTTLLTNIKKILCLEVIKTFFSLSNAFSMENVHFCSVVSEISIKIN